MEVFNSCRRVAASTNFRTAVPQIESHAVFNVTNLDVFESLDYIFSFVKTETNDGLESSSEINNVLETWKATHINFLSVGP
jgi:hypothetical protein